MVTTIFKDNTVRLFLDGELVDEQESFDGITIGTYVELEDEEVEKKDCDAAFVGKGASLLNAFVSVDGYVDVDEGGKLAAINVNGGTLTGSPLCENASNWYGGGICLTATGTTADASGAVILSGGTFSACTAVELNGYAGVGGGIDTWGGVITVENGLFFNNTALGTGSAGGAMGLLYSTSTVTGGTFSGNSAYFGGAIQQNAGSLTVTGAVFTGNTTIGEATSEYAPGGGALEIHSGALATVSGSTFTANSSLYGGAVYNDTHKGAVSQSGIAGCVFDANTASQQGGAIYNYASLTVTDSVFSGNSVTDPDPYSYMSFGGAVANTKNGTLTVTGGSFTGNYAVQGGAIATFIDYGSADTANLTVTDSSFDGNTSAYGGGIYIQTGLSDMTAVSGTDFGGNSASYGGGAICQCFGALTVTGGTFSANSAGNDGGAIAVWDSGNTASLVSGAAFDANTAAYGGAISHAWASAALTVSGCTFTANGGETALQGGAIWNDPNSSGLVTISGCTFGGNTAAKGGALYNAGNMKLENIVLATASDTVYNVGSLAISGANTLGASVVNDGKITLSLASATDAVVSDLGQISGTGSVLVKLSAESAAAGAALAASAGTFSGSLSVKLGDVASTDAFTLADGALGNDLAIAGTDVLRLAKGTDGALTVGLEALADLVPVVSADGSILTWTNAAGAAAGYWVEIAQDNTFDAAVRIATDGKAFDLDAEGAFAARTALADGTFTADPVTWTAAPFEPRQIASNANGRADVFFVSVAEGDVWTARYQAKNTVTGETAAIAGKNRIRDTFSGSESDANILYLTDSANGDALFMDDIYSEFGTAARLNLIREVRAGAGDDVVDMTAEHYTAELAGMTVRGGSGDDVVWGANGGNKLFGDAGSDVVSGGTGDDIISGGSGDDILKGGGGTDTFTFGENWGTDVVSQLAGGSVTLWFAQDQSQIATSEIEGNAVFTSGTNVVTVAGFGLADVVVHYGDDRSAEFAALAAAGAFLGSTAESVFETQEARTQGILAAL